MCVLDRSRPLTPEQDDLKHLVLSIFDKYTQMRNDFGHALCGHVNSLFEIEPYDAVKHESWVRSNSCLMEYLLEFRSTAKHEWSLLRAELPAGVRARKGHTCVMDREGDEHSGPAMVCFGGRESCCGVRLCLDVTHLSGSVTAYREPASERGPALVLRRAQELRRPAAPP